MNVDLILATLNQHAVRYLLIGGMNFMIRHQPILTYDLDVWIDDSQDNRACCEAALSELGAEWGPTEETWGLVSKIAPGWLANQSVFCLTSLHGAIDVFRAVEGLGDWHISWNNGQDGSTSTGITFRGLSDEDMLGCQLALAVGLQKQDRIRLLREAIVRRAKPT